MESFLTLVSAFVPALLTFGIIAGLIALLVRAIGRNQARNEALFVSMFPDLQPYYHPAKLFQYATARLKETPPRTGKVWKNPPGFEPYVADIRFEGEREIARLLDAAGALLTQFIFETHSEGAAIRVGKGKFTVSTRDKTQQRVRYWHPDREFKWTPQMWKFNTRVAERPIDTSSNGTSYSSDSSSSSSRVAAAAPFVAAGGAFDGGGASQSWSEGGAAGSRGGGSTAATTSY